MFSHASGHSAETRAARCALVASAAARPGEQTSEQRRSLRYAAVYLFVVLAAAVLLAAQVAAQQPAAGGGQGYATVAIPANLSTPEAVRTMEIARRAMPTEPNPDKNSTNYRAFQAYYTQYIFAKMTQPESRAELGSILEDIRKDLERALRSGSPAAADMRSWILRGAGGLATGSYHPAVRVGATLLLGQLDDQLGVNGQPPVPSAAAFRGLVFLYKNTDNDGVRAAALHGLHRHVRYGFYNLPANTQDELTKQMFELAQSDPPEGRDPAAHAFLQRYAVDILAILNTPQRSPQVTQTLVGLSSSPDASPVISLYAAETLGRLATAKELTPIQQAEQVIGAWAAKAAEAFAREAERLASLTPPPAVSPQPTLIDPNAMRRGGYSGGGYGYGGDAAYDGGYDAGGYSGGDYGGYASDMYAGGYGYGGMAANTTPQPPEVIASRRRINAALQSLHLGLTGSAKQELPREPQGLSADAAVKATADQLVTAIHDSAASLNDTTLITEEAFIEMLRAEADQLQQLADTLAPPPAAPADPGATPAPPAAAPAEEAPAETPEVAALPAN